MPKILIYKNHEKFVRFFLPFTAVIISLAANFYLPSLPSLSNYLQTSPEDMEFTVTFFLLGFGSSQLIYGPLSDKFGRRKILLIGFIVALLASLGCLYATSGREFILFRFILGCGVGAGSALSRSILRDAFGGTQLMKIAAFNGIIASLSQVITPIAGSYSDQLFGFRISLLLVTLFIAFILIIVWIFLLETNPELNPKALHPTHFIKNYLFILSHKTFLGNVIAAGFAFSSLNVFLTVSPFLFQKTLGISIIGYGWITTTVLIGLILGRVLNSFLLNWYKPQQILHLAITLMLLGAILLLIPCLFAIINVAVIIIPVTIFMIGSSIIMTIAYAQSLEPFAKMAGFAGALYGALMTLLAFASSGLVAILKSDDQNLLAIVYLGLAIGTLLAYQLTKSSPTTITR